MLSFSADQKKLRFEIENEVKKGFSKWLELQTKLQTTSQDGPPHTSIEGNNMFLLEENFKCLLSTIILFLEQDNYFNVPLNLDVNFRCVHQDNFFKEGTNILKSIIEENGVSFQNSPICLMFYQKNIQDPMEDPVDQETEVSLLS